MLDLRNVARCFAMAAIVAAALAPAAGAVDLADQQILRKGNGAEPATLDPHKAESVPDQPHQAPVARCSPQLISLRFHSWCKHRRIHHRVAENFQPGTFFCISISSLRSFSPARW